MTSPAIRSSHEMRVRHGADFETKVVGLWRITQMKLKCWASIRKPSNSCARKQTENAHQKEWVCSGLQRERVTLQQELTSEKTWGFHAHFILKILAKLQAIWESNYYIGTLRRFTTEFNIGISRYRLVGANAPIISSRQPFKYHENIIQITRRWCHSWTILLLINKTIDWKFMSNHSLKLSLSWQRYKQDAMIFRV